MSDEQNDVKVEAEPTTSSVVSEQEPIISEDVKPQSSEVQENLRKALQAERERRREAEDRKAELERELENKESTQVTTDDDVYARFIRLEAENKINTKILNDPTFKDRVDLVRDTMVKTGFDVDIADSVVKSQLYDQLIKESISETVREPVPNQIKSQATPETIIKKTGNVLDDVESGAMKVDPMLRATIAKYRKRD